MPVKVDLGERDEVAMSGRIFSSKCDARHASICAAIIDAVVKGTRPRELELVLCTLALPSGALTTQSCAKPSMQVSCTALHSHGGSNNNFLSNHPSETTYRARFKPSSYYSSCR